LVDPLTVTRWRQELHGYWWSSSSRCWRARSPRGPGSGSAQQPRKPSKQAEGPAHSPSAPRTATDRSLPCLAWLLVLMFLNGQSDFTGAPGLGARPFPPASIIL